MSLRALSLILASSLLLAACGYRPLGTTVAPPQRIYIQLVQNDTSRAAINDQLTNRIVERLARSPIFRVVETRADADLLFEGRLLRYSATPRVYDADDRAVTYRVEAVLSATIRNSASRGGGIYLRAELPAGEDFPADLDRGVQQGSERTAAAAVCERLADDLHARLVDEAVWRTPATATQ